MFAALLLLMGSLKQIDIPNYDSIQALKTAHDMGENRTSAPPLGFNATSVSPCGNGGSAVLAYYNATQEVCMI